MPDPALPVLVCRPEELGADLRLVPGWTGVDGFLLPRAPWDLAPQRLMCIGRVTDLEVARQAVAAAARGVGLAVSVELTGDDKRRFLEDLERLGASPAGKASTTADLLDADHGELLAALATGATLTAAAADLHLSRRTAHRRIAEARQRLGVNTTVEAVAAWLADR